MSTSPQPAVALHELSQRFYFESAHTLRRTIEAEGSRRVHGHTYEAEVTVRGTPDAGGMVIDLAYLRRTIAALREKLDHHFLDEVQGIGIPTLENLCSYIRRELEPQVPGLCAVSVWRQASGDRCALRW